MKKIFALLLILALALTTTTTVLAKKKAVWTAKRLTKAVKSVRKIVTELQDKVEALEARDNMAAVTYEGTIDTTAAGETTTVCAIVGTGAPDTCHWKEVSVPELDLTKSPNVQLLTKQPATLSGLISVVLPTGAWQVNNAPDVSNAALAIDNGKVYILFKGTTAGSIIDGNYKIIVTYKK